MVEIKNVVVKKHKAEEVGKNIKSTKKKYTWIFEISKVSYCCELYVSMLSHKRKVVINGKTLLMKTLNAKDQNFQWTHVIKGFEISIRQYNSIYLLFIEGQDFTYLMNSQKEREGKDGGNDSVSKSPCKSPTKDKVKEEKKEVKANPQKARVGNNNNNTSYNHLL